MQCNGQSGNGKCPGHANDAQAIVSVHERHIAQHRPIDSSHIPLRVEPAAGSGGSLKMSVDGASEVVLSNELRQCASKHLIPPFRIGFSETLFRHDEGDMLTEQPIDELVPGPT